MRANKTAALRHYARYNRRRRFSLANCRKSDAQTTNGNGKVRECNGASSWVVVTLPPPPRSSRRTRERRRRNAVVVFVGRRPWWETTTTTTTTEEEEIKSISKRTKERTNAGNRR
ncbi:hypothetical protein N9D57_01535 [bacterium]|nr:hypothetical protein [bacterium]